MRGCGSAACDLRVVLLVAFLLGLADPAPWPCPACRAAVAEALGGADRVADALGGRRV